MKVFIVYNPLQRGRLAIFSGAAQSIAEFAEDFPEVIYFEAILTTE